MSWNLDLGSLNPFNPSTSSASSKPKKRPRPNGKKPSHKHKADEWGFIFGKKKKKKLTAMEKLARIAEVDQELSQEAPTRWRPDITPKDKKFKSQLASFERMLRGDDMSLQKILDTIFAPEERQLLLPINPERNPPLAKVQEDNARQFREMLKSEDFEDLKNDSNPTALKLTLAYFGIPTGPIAPFEGMGRYDEDEMSDGERELPLFPPRVRNARFANKYAKRLYAFDHSRRADPFLESYYTMDVCYAPPEESIVPGSAPELTLRGGGGEDASLGLRGGGGDDASLTLRGGANGVENFDLYHAYENYKTTLDGDPPKKYTGWMTLYGYQGQVAFEPSSLNTFVDAVDRLLGLDCRAGVIYKVHMRDRKAKSTKSAWKTKVAVCQGVGNFEADQKVLDWIREQLPNYAPGEDDIRTNMILFVSAGADPDPSHWEPREKDRVLKFGLLWPDNSDLCRPDIAYLRVPRNLSSVKYANQYHSWMASICRILAAGQIPYRPGRPSVPNAHFSLNGYPPGGRYVGSYGGLAFLPQLWASITKSWKANPKQSVMLNAKTLTKGLGDRIFLFLPGSSQPLSSNNYILFSELSDRKRVESTILELVKRSMAEEILYEDTELMGVEITFPGEWALAHWGRADLFLPVTTEDGGDGQDQKGPIVSALEEWLNYFNARKIVAPAENGFQMYPQFLALRPKFNMWRLVDAAKLDEAIRSLKWDPMRTPVEFFRRMAVELLGLKNVDANSIYVEYRQTPKAPKGQRQIYTKPKFVIGPETTEEEWRVMRRWIVEPEGYITLLDERVKPIFGEQPFGFRDIYTTPAGQLYGGLKEEYQPVSQRYHDYQALNENASLRLITRDPGGKARQKEVAPEKTQKTSSARFKITQPGHSLDFLNDPAFTTLQKALQLREYSYYHPLDVHISNSIPINAPPLQTIVSIGKDSTPKLALGVLTPSEVRRLKQDYFTLRNVLLDRTQTCPHAGCKQTYGVTQRAELQQHLNEAHGAKEKCPFCDHPLFPFWTESQRGQHIAQAHPDRIPGLQQITEDPEESTETPNNPGETTSNQATSTSQTTETPPPPPPPPPPQPEIVATSPVQAEQKPGTKAPKPPAATPTPSIPGDFDPVSKYTGPSPRDGEKQWHYCARCGRDHRLLSNRLDRERHDKICGLGTMAQYRVPNGPGAWEACPVCAAYIPKSAQGQHADHRPGPHPHAPYCFLCGIGLGLFDAEYGDTHKGFCKGYGGDRINDFKYCPWCREEFGRGELFKAAEWVAHVRACESAPKKSSMKKSDTYALALGLEEGWLASQAEKADAGSDSDADGEYIEPEPKPKPKKKTRNSAAAAAAGSAPATPVKSAGPTTRSKSGIKKPATWKIQEEAAPSVKGPGMRKKAPAAATGAVEYPVEMDLDEPEPEPEAPVVGGRKVSFSDVVQVKEIESIQKPAGVKRKASEGGKFDGQGAC